MRDRPISWPLALLAAALVAVPLAFGAVANWRYVHGHVVATADRGYWACEDAGCHARWRLPGRHGTVTGLVRGAPYEWEEEAVAGGNKIWVAQDGTASVLGDSPEGRMALGYGAAALLVLLAAAARRHRRTAAVGA